ncbi:unnamed protein product, partial [marine sediment metagenome]
ERLSPQEIVAIELSDKERKNGLLKQVCEEKERAEEAVHSNDDNQLFYCGAGKTSFTIDPYGFFKLCSSLSHPDCVYDLRKGSLREAWEEFVPQIRSMQTDELQKIDEQKIKVVVPSQRQASRKEPKPFHKSNFQYDSEKDCYICPEGHFLTYRRTNKREQNKVYIISEKTICKQCPHWGVCTKSQQGRQITRLINEEVRQRLEAQYEEAESQT